MEMDEVLRKLEVGINGLNKKEAERRLQKYGYNELKEKKRRTALHMFLDQFKDIFMLLLIVAIIFSVVVGYYETLMEPTKGFIETYTDAITIGVIVILCATAGFVQEYKAEKAVEALKKLTAPEARVIRDGREVTIPAREVVPGDILVLETGDRVPADARIIEAVELKTNEAVLTGESTPIKKEVTVVKEDAPISERKNMVYAGTHIVYGRGKAVVVATGMNTEFGKIAEMVQTAEEERTPLQRKLDRFASKLAKLVIGVCVLIFALEAFEVAVYGWKVEGFIQAFMSSIALAISAVPEGLPAIVTITLALGAREFAKRNAIVRRLASAETLGAVTVICSDKTGTLTKGEMTVRKIYVDDKVIEVTGVGYEPKGEFILNNDAVKPEKDLLLLLKIGALCNNARIERNDKNNTWQVVGDPTEGALLVSAAKAGIKLEELEKHYPRIGEVIFTSERKRMTTVHITPEGTKVAYMKGAPEVVLERCNSVLMDGKEVKLTEKMKRKILKMNDKFANEALRVLGMAYKTLPEGIREFNEKTVEEDLVFVGLQGMIDPPREEAIEAIKTCQEAGIKTVMITGDHKLTAVAIAKEIGIMQKGNIVLTGEQLDKMTQEELEKIVENVTVYARVSPEHKLKIVNALKAKGHIVAMTGDGVND
ncbi:ATPase, partial [Candidatus Aerophobetes bacterium]